jgi:hypothetical protein
VLTRLIRAERPRLRIFWRRLWLEKFGRLRARAMLAIASFIIYYLDWQTDNNFGSFARTATIRSPVCSREMRPLAFLDPRAFPRTYSAIGK